VGAAITRRQLNEAQPVAIDVEPQRLGIDGDAGAEVEPRGKIVLVQRN
jgi:hypothetical protein